MVEFNNSHKASSKHELIAGGKSGNTIVDFYNEKGEWGEIDVSKLSTNDLWALRRQMKDYFDTQIKVIDDELDNWSDISCHICGQQDLAYRGQPFITWGFRAGYIMCPRHVRAFDLKGTPEGELIEQARKERKELEEIFG